MDSSHKQKTDPIKHCPIDEIRICTRCGSINVKIEGDAMIARQFYALNI